MVQSERARTRVALLDAARNRWLHGQRLDLNSLAVEHGISRATAYRWFGSNDRLAGEVIASMVARTFQDNREATIGNGATRVVAILRAQLSITKDSTAMKAYIERDPQTALAVLTTHQYPVQRTLTQLIEGLLVEEVARENLSLRIEPSTLAYALTRLMEAFAYADVVAGRSTSLEEAVNVFASLLT
ncbi:QsdR family transcriptional regulator [Rhodococcus sp. NPDC057014]|uniref:QsdR family transcriptional regulator n=1 Tax=Rhodococcus sp. NPDC057014 TaxID=3346000 RepID=UPI0036433E32